MMILFYSVMIEVALVISTLRDMTCMDEIRGKEPVPKGQDQVNCCLGIYRTGI